MQITNDTSSIKRTVMDPFFRDLIWGAIAIAAMAIGLYAGSEINKAHNERTNQAMINNVVTAALESERHVNCKDNYIIEAIKAMAANGAHVKEYNLWLEINDKGTGGYEKETQE